MTDGILQNNILGQVINPFLNRNNSATDTTNMTTAENQATPATSIGM